MKRMIIMVVGISIVLGLLAAYQWVKFHDGRLHIVFCDVGQGDAIFITTPNNKHILIDSGPDKRVLDCLSAHLPFWQRTIDLAILTHPHSDHDSGYYYVLQRYVITHFVTEDLQNKAAGFQELLRILKQEHIPEQFVLAGDVLSSGDVTLKIAGPTKQFLNTTSPGGFIGEGREFASVVTYVTYGKFHALLTGDSQVVGLQDASVQIDSTVDVMQVPHHGSASGLDEHVLQFLQPKLAVVSVGAHNRYGHPTKLTLDLLRESGIKTLRTDQNGTVEITSDGETWDVKTAH